MLKLFIYIAALLGILAVIKILAEKYLPAKKQAYSYRRKGSLISDAEHKFFDVLVSSVGNQYYIFPQVHLSDLLDHDVVGQNWRGAFSHINGKSVDFVLCDKQGIAPLLVIELDDRSHTREDRELRDEEVERILKESGLPLLRFENHGRFEKEDVINRISEKLDQRESR